MGCVVTTGETGICNTTVWQQVLVLPAASVPSQVREINMALVGVVLVTVWRTVTATELQLSAVEGVLKFQGLPMATFRVAGVTVRVGAVLSATRTWQEQLL